MTNKFVVTDQMRSQRTYGGADLKFGIQVDGEFYIVKPYDAPNYSEYVASRFITALGFKCQEVWHGTYQGKPCAIIKDFLPDGFNLHHYSDINSSSRDTVVQDKSYTLRDILDIIQKNHKMSEIMRLLAEEQFWQMFVCDAILANRDRHPGNWGYITGPGVYEPAPIFDNGGALFPGIHKVIHEFNGFDFVWERSDFFPASMLKGPDGRKMNYYDAFRTVVPAYSYQYLTSDVVKRCAAEATFGLPTEFAFVLQEIILCRYLHIVVGLDKEVCRAYASC